MGSAATAPPSRYPARDETGGGPAGGHHPRGGTHCAKRGVLSQPYVRGAQAALLLGHAEGACWAHALRRRGEADEGEAPQPLLQRRRARRVVRGLDEVGKAGDALTSASIRVSESHRPWVRV